MTDRELLIQIYNTLQSVEIKGFDNIDKMFGLMYTIREQLKNNQESNIEE